MEYFDQSPIESIKNSLEELGIYNSSDDSFISTLTSAVDTQLDNLQDSIETVQDNIHLSSATGKSLEDHLEPFGITRSQSSNPVFSMKIEIESDYYPTDLTDDNTGIIIPASTLSAVASNDSSLMANCMDDVYFGPNDKVAYGTFILDSSILEDQIIPVNTFTLFQSDAKDNIEGLKTSTIDLFDIVGTNDQNITIKTQGEDDNEFRIKGINILRSTTERMQIAVETALNAIPDVVDIQFIKNKIGVGTAAVILTVTNQSEIDSVYAVAKDILNGISDDSLILIQPDYIEVEVHNRVTFVENSTADQITTAKNEIISNQMQAINRTPTGQDFDIALLSVNSNSVVQLIEVTCLKLDGVPMDVIQDIKSSWDEKLTTTIYDSVPPIKFIM